MDIKGIWTTKEEFATHAFDEPLCQVISEIFSGTFADLGCGNGAYTKYLQDHGFICHGFDGSPFTPDFCFKTDFTELIDLGKYDNVLCLEVGEHIPKQYETIFLDNICNTAKDFIILSWGVPGQGGTGHVNCQTNMYVMTEMFKRGWIFNKTLTKILRHESTFSWFKNTLMVYE
jgi:hypothetical protein